MNDVGVILANPVTALVAAAVCILSFRFLVAWSVWQRIRGWGPSGANLHPKRVRSDYPRPNDPVLEGVILLFGWIAFWFVVTIGGPPAPDPAVPSWVGPSIFFGAAIVSAIYAFRRIREDDRRQRRVLGERLASESDQRPS
jgi:hypothetical protein